MRNLKKGFTLAEVMIVLTVIGVLTAILLPVARQSMPDENLMKFKKAHNTLGTVIRELVTSDKYYKDGDLGVKTNGDIVDSSTYFCETIADVLNVKNVNCAETKVSDYLLACRIAIGETECVYRTDDDLKSTLDWACRNTLENANQVVLNDGSVFFETSSFYHFGITEADLDEVSDVLTGADGRFYTSVDHQNFYRIYKFFCIDIDGVPNNVTTSNCVNECPFGYGIRVDGKILTGARADEWLEREVNGE